MKYVVNRNLNRIIVGILIVSAFVFGFIGRDWLIDGETAADSREPTFALIAQADQLINSLYLRELPDDMTREYAAIRGLLASLDDPNTFFIEPPVAQSEADALTGTYGGIGVTLQRDADGKLRMYPFPDSPAEASGIRDGYELIAVNGNTVTLDMDIDQIRQLLRGEVRDDNGVDVTYLTDEDNGEKSVFIEFQSIEVPSVVFRMVPDTDIAYVQITQFTNRTPSELHTALQQLIPDVETGLILDLRNNNGGLLQESIEVANEFLSEGFVVYQRDRESVRGFEANTDGIGVELPIVVLVNQATASASELVAGAIQGNDRGILIGQPTYGKGTIQQIHNLADGSSMHITTAEWLLPNEQPLEGNGLVPDIALERDDMGRDLEIEAAIRYIQGLSNSESDK